MSQTPDRAGPLTRRRQESAYVSRDRAQLRASIDIADTSCACDRKVLSSRKRKLGELYSIAIERNIARLPSDSQGPASKSRYLDSIDQLQYV
jgi:hypothetical protein